MGTFYISTPIYYVNDLPHIGHIYTTVVADVVARYRRLAGDEVFFVTGTDEHGVNIERTAAEKGISPQEQADRVVSRYHRLWEELAISHDDFIRTTEARHRRAVTELVRRIEARGDLYVDRHEGWYCASCETFYTEKELLPGQLCPTHEREVEWQSEENLFFRLARYQEALAERYRGGPPFVAPPGRLNEVRSFVEGGLRDISVSRAGATWGVPFPGHPGQTVYVWLDALTNYLSALGFGSEDPSLAERFWMDPEAERLHLIGKDILRFHAVWWPAFLLSAELPLPSRVAAHGWWLRDEKKMSKSTGNVVRPDALMRDFGADPLRYFLMREMSFGQDASFSDEAFVDRYNSDLANDLGNTISRVVKLSRKTFDGRTPPEACGDNPLIAAAAEAVEAYHREMRELNFDRALRALSALIGQVNQYLVEREPWKLVKSEGASARVARILWNGLEGVRVATTALLPVMPTVAPRLLAAVGTAEAPGGFEALAWGGTPLGAELPPAEPLFPRVDKQDFLAGGEAPERPAAIAETPSDEVEGEGMIDIGQFFETELKVATVTEAERVEGADRLLRLVVDLGDESRQLVAGIAESYEPASLVGRQIVMVANLEPATIRGVESQGMLLAASGGGKTVLVGLDEPVPNGTPVK